MQEKYSPDELKQDFKPLGITLTWQKLLQQQSPHTEVIQEVRRTSVKVGFHAAIIRMVWYYVQWIKLQRMRDTVTEYSNHAVY